jgi:hypothetical protein
VLEHSAFADGKTLSDFTEDEIIAEPSTRSSYFTAQAR